MPSNHSPRPRASARARRLAGALILLAHAPLVPGVLAAQRDSATVVAGAHYAAGGTRQTLLGRSYRDLWTAPARVPVLDLGSYAGGLTPVEKGGGNQTRSLRFHGADGREYGFRSIDKVQGRDYPADVQGTLVNEILQDQISSLVPGGVVAADRLLAAAGVLHADLAIYVMPDDPRLGEFRRDFAGMLGTLEERPKAGKTEIPGLAGAADFKDTDALVQALEQDPANRVDAPAYLAARLMDIYLGDWDRHEDQYEWAGFDAGGQRTWRPVPRDRDYVFVDYDGLLLGFMRSAMPTTIRYQGTYGSALSGLTALAPKMDRRLLGPLSRAAWDSVVANLRARLTDAVIDQAVAALPEAYRAREGAHLADVLRARRDNLPEVAGRFYAQLAREPEVHATNLGDSAVVERRGDGSVDVRVFAPGGVPYFQRRLTPSETREVRLFMHGGGDRVIVSGDGRPRIAVRVVGGDGDDVLEDATPSGSRVAFYDDAGENRFVRRPGTTVDTRPFKEPEYAHGGGRRPPRDWGVKSSLVSPTAGTRPNAGVFVGIGPARTAWGFRRYPDASEQSLRALWAVQYGRFALEYNGLFRRLNSPDRFEVLARGSNMEATRFHGFGNATTNDGIADHYRLWERQALLEPTFWHAVGDGAWLSLGGTLRWSDPEPRAGTPAALLAPLGTRSFGTAAARAELLLERAGNTAYPRRGYTLEVTGMGGPVFGDESGAFGDLRGEGRAYLPATPSTTLALRAGGQRVWGDFPLQYAAFLGGGSSLRGHPSQRFAGDAEADGSAELRQVLTRAEIVVRGDLGVFALADAGRVWYHGDSPDGWHTALGGGAFFSFLDHSHSISVAVAHGESTRVHFSMGMPF